MLTQQALDDLHYRLSIIEKWGPDAIFNQNVMDTMKRWLEEQDSTKLLLLRLIYLMPPGQWATREFSAKYENNAKDTYTLTFNTDGSIWTVSSVNLQGHTVNLGEVTALAKTYVHSTSDKTIIIPCEKKDKKDGT